MPTLKNVSSKTWQDLRPETSRDFSAEEMQSDAVKRALRMGLLIEGPASEQANDTRQTQQRPQPTRR